MARLEKNTPYCQLCTIIASNFGQRLRSQNNPYLVTFSDRGGLGLRSYYSNRWESIMTFTFNKLLLPDPDIQWQQHFETHRHIWDQLPGDISTVVLVPEEYPMSPEALKLARKWLTVCQKTRPRCIAAQRRIQKPPKRIWDVSGAETVVLLEPAGNEVCEYATLSYCWGTLGVPLKTTTANLQSHCTGIPINSFPATLRDAILIVQELGIRYLWIDALCIVQDGDGGQDWAEQAAEMTSIYQGGILNISAVDGDSCDSGLRPKQLRDIGIKIGTSVIPTEILFLIGQPSSSRRGVDLSQRPLSTRGWAFQERLVSPATLHYTDRGMIWECCTEVEVERTWPVWPGPTDFPFRPQGFSTHEFKSPKQLWNYAKTWLTEPTPGPREPADQLYVWYLALEDYTVMDLTFERDRLPALAGIAARISRQFGFTYLAGIWKEDLAHGLCWRAVEHRKEGDQRGPSWSWVSANGLSAPAYEYRCVTEMIRVSESLLHEEYPGTFGRVLSGRLDIDGKIWKVSILPGELSMGMRVALPGFFQPDKKGRATFYADYDHIYQLYEAGRLECWLLLVGEFVRRDSPKAWEVRFLALEKTEVVKAGCRETYRRIGLVEYRSSDNPLVKTWCEETVPGQQVSLSLV